MSREHRPDHEERSSSSFEADLEAKLAKGIARQRREQQRKVAAVSPAQAMQARAEQMLPVRQAAAEAAAAAMKADARKAAEMMRSFGYPPAVPVRLARDSQIVDLSRRPYGYEHLRRRLFRSPITVFTHDGDTVDVWRVTRKNGFHYNEAVDNGTGYTSYWQTGLALTAGGEIVRYIGSWNGLNNENNQLSEGLRYGAVVDYACQGPATVNELAPIQYAREDGTYDPAVLERWQAQLLAIQ